MTSTWQLKGERRGIWERDIKRRTRTGLECCCNNNNNQSVKVGPTTFTIDLFFLSCVLGGFVISLNKTMRQFFGLKNYYLPWAVSKQIEMAATGGRKWTSASSGTPCPPKVRRVWGTGAGCVRIRTPSRWAGWREILFKYPAHKNV